MFTRNRRRNTAYGASTTLTSYDGPNDRYSSSVGYAQPGAEDGLSDVPRGVGGPHVTSNDSDPRVGVLVLGALALVSVVLGYGVGRNNSERFLITGIVITILFILGILAITGHLASLFQLLGNHRAYRAAENIASKRMEAAGWEAEERIARLDHEHELAMFVAKQDGEVAELRGQMLRLEAAMVDGRKELPAARPPTFVPARPDPAAKAARAWVFSLSAGGRWDPDKIHAKGGLRIGTPWKTEWKNEDWADDAFNLLVPLVLVPVRGKNGATRGYKVVHDGPHEADKAITNMTGVYSED